MDLREEAAKAKEQAAILERQAAEEAKADRLAAVISNLRALGIRVAEGMGFVATRLEVAEAFVFSSDRLPTDSGAPARGA